MVRSSGTTDTIWYVTYGKGIFVAVGGTNTVLTSANGETWEKRSIDGAAGLWGVVYANDTFVAVGYGGSIYTSADGVSWKGRTSGVVLSLLNAGYGRDTFVIVGEEGTILQSDPLAPPSHYALSVGRKGTGAGTVTSIPPGISCGTDCSEPFARDTVVTLYAEAAPGSTFAGWSGACSGTGTCTVTMNEDRFVTAAFAVPEHVLTVVRSGAGAGTVTSSPAGISCGEDCSQSYPQGSSVTLTASASAGSSFAGWSGGGCSGTGTCVVSVNAATTVTADFTLLPCTYKLTPASKAFTANGGTVTVTVVGTGQAVCAAPGVIAPGWVTTTQSAWVKNRGTVKITVLKNPSSLPKSDTVTIGGVPFAVTQAGAPCAITRFIPTSQSFGKAPGSGSFAVEVAPQDCAWTTSVSAAAMPWLHITSGAGTGNGTVQYGIDENLGKVSRTGTITVTLTQNAKKKAFTVRQGNK
jgi:hypothetical protein